MNMTSICLLARHMPVYDTECRKTCLVSRRNHKKSNSSKLYSLSVLAKLESLVDQDSVACLQKWRSTADQ